MIRPLSKKVLRQFFAISSAFAVLLMIGGCSQTCTIPTERAPAIRVINAMTDQPTLNIFLDGVTLDANYPYELPDGRTYPTLGYYSTYANGKALHAGQQKLVAIAVSGDTVIDTTVVVSEHRHTLIFIGKDHRPDITKILLFDDELDSRDPNQNEFRYVDAIPDLPAMDVYLSKTLKGVQPDFQLRYGELLSHKTENIANGITITVAGDTSDVIFRLQSLLTLPGFFYTIILRGEKHPSGTEPIIETNLISDLLPGAESFQFNSFGVRFVNGTRTQPLNLMPRGPQDHGPRVDLPQQNLVMAINPDSVSDWAPFNPTTHGSEAAGKVTWVFGTWNYPLIDTFFVFEYYGKRNLRYTMIALDTSTLASGLQGLDSMILLDTITYPPAGTSRIRVVNLSPDHTVMFTLGGKNFTLPQRGVGFVDIPSGSFSFTAHDANNGSFNETISGNAPSGKPVSLFFFPDISAGQMPYRVAPE